MDIYKKASKEKLRFNTQFGNLTTEQLWDLELPDLDSLAVKLQEEHKESGKKSFLEVKSKKDKIAKLKFDIVLDVLNTKVDYANRAAKALETKQYNAKIDALIVEKQDEELKGMTVEELEKLRK